MLLFQAPFALRSPRSLAMSNAKSKPVHKAKFPFFSVAVSSPGVKSFQNASRQRRE